MSRIIFAAPRIKRYETDDFQPSGEPRFIAISLRGMECHLMCDHCGTRMLAALHRAETPERLLSLCEKMHGRGCRGLLLTGGCDADGKIPLLEFVDAAREVKRRWGYRIAVHTKLADEEFVEAVADIGADLLMLDVIGDENSLREVYHLHGRSLSDIEAGLTLAEARGVPLAPHIMIGIANGQIIGERRALEMLRGRRLASLVLVVLSPMRFTPMTDVEVDIDAALEVMTEARRLFPDTPLTLGCAKTGGADQRRLEEHAIDLAFDTIAYPSDGIVTLARERGFDVRFSEECCAFEAMIE